MDRQYQPVHLKARVHELEEEEVLELEALLEQKKAAEVTNQRLEELRVKPGSRLEWEYLEQAVQEWKKEKNIRPKKKTFDRKKIKHIVKIAAAVCATAFGIYGITQGLIYASKSTPEEIAAEKQLNELVQTIDLNCDSYITVDEFAKAYEHATGKKFPETVSEKKQSTSIKLYLDDTVKGIDITEYTFSNNYSYTIALSNATAQQIAEKYKDKAVCRLSL